VRLSAGCSFQKMMTIIIMTMIRRLPQDAPRLSNTGVHNSTPRERRGKKGLKSRSLVSCAWPPLDSPNFSTCCYNVVLLYYTECDVLCLHAYYYLCSAAYRKLKRRNRLRFAPARLQSKGRSLNYIYWYFPLSRNWIKPAEVFLYADASFNTADNFYVWFIF
jgi:hypothetical protein